MERPLLTVVICSYKVRELLRDCLNSVYQDGGVGSALLEVIVVDNASGDGSVAMVRREFPAVRLIANEDNRGFSRANNQALRIARGRYLLLLNPDMVVLDDALALLTSFMEEHPEAGACGGDGLSPELISQPQFTRAIPTPMVALYHFLGLDRFFPKSRRFGRYNYTFADRTKILDVEAVSGSCMMVRHEAMARVGLLDERFPMYAEDLDWCLRFAQADWKLYYVPTARFIHHHGQSSRKNLLWSTKQFYLTMHSFYAKHFHSRYPAIVNALVGLGVLAGLGLKLLLVYLKVR